MKQINQIIENLLKLLGFEDFEIETKELIGEPLTFNIKMPEGSLLIGDQGGNLRAIEQIVKVVFYKEEKPEEEIKFILDVNGYRSERVRFIKQLAKEFCQKVILTKQPATLPPLNAYERRIIHMELAAHPSVITESQGEGEERKLIIKPYP